MAVESVPQDALIEAYDRAQSELREASESFPRLVVDTVTDDGETYMALRCPRCGLTVDDGELYAISPAEHWGPNDYVDDNAFDHQIVTFDSSERPDLEETLYYMHGDNGHAVSLPDGWTEDWG